MSPSSYPKRDDLSLLLSSSSFHCSDEKKDLKAPVSPGKKSVYITIAFIVAFLALSERLHYNFITSQMDIHPILENITHRQIIARHIGVDAFSCLVIAYIGYINRHILKEVLTTQRSEALDNNFHSRIYTYQPEGHRVLLFFLSYQVKNLYDSWYWNDGLLFIFHHIFAGFTAWLGMYPGTGSMYGLFFMGMSEISTCVLCLLANFDPQFGVSGLDEAFPNTKIALAAAFVVSFLICRIVLWPIFTYHFLFDCLKALKRDSVKETSKVKSALVMMMISSVGLTILQFVWLGEIITTAREEITALL